MKQGNVVIITTEFRDPIVGSISDNPKPQIVLASSEISAQLRNPKNLLKVF